MFAPGLETFFSEDHGSRRLRIAAVTNFTGRDRHGVHLVKRLAADSRFELKRVFTPEHGFNSDAPDGEAVANSRDNALNIDIISLYGEMKKPSADLLADLDLLVYDMQDVGVRFYTYISTLRNIIETAAKCNVAVAVLDRPDVLGGCTVEGPMLEQGFSSFVSHLAVPLRYGLTPGELALWFKDSEKLDVKLKIYQCQDYSCPTSYGNLNFPWFKPSPSMPDIKTAAFYPGTCLYEGTEISEGRGTEAPFRNLGAPWINPNLWLQALTALLPQGITAVKTEFVPTFSKHMNEKCFGIRLESSNDFFPDAVKIGISTLYALMASHPNKLTFTGRPNLTHPFIDYLAGTDKVRKGLLANKKPCEIISDSDQGTKDFALARSQFFLYPRHDG